MKKLICLLLCLLLCGCAAPPEETAPPSAAPTQPVIAEPSGCYAPGDPAEAATGGAVRAYPLPIPWCQGFTVIEPDVQRFLR